MKQTSREPGGEIAPRYESWTDFLSKTTEKERREWCASKRRVANRPKLMSGSAEYRLSTQDVVDVLEAAQGRCHWCCSLAVERRPSGPAGAPLPWADIGRRIGSLDHVLSLCDSGTWPAPGLAAMAGTNEPANLVWSCLWCNTWPSERVVGATDHGAIQ
jgi:hypothetical protein